MDGHQLFMIRFEVRKALAARVSLADDDRRSRDHVRRGLEDHPYPLETRRPRLTVLATRRFQATDGRAG